MYIVYIYMYIHVYIMYTELFVCFYFKFQPEIQPLCRLPSILTVQSLLCLYRHGDPSFFRYQHVQSSRLARTRVSLWA